MSHLLACETGTPKDSGSLTVSRTPAPGRECLHTEKHVRQGGWGYVCVLAGALRVTQLKLLEVTRDLRGLYQPFGDREVCVCVCAHTCVCQGGSQLNWKLQGVQEEKGGGLQARRWLAARND